MKQIIVFKEFVIESDGNLPFVLRKHRSKKRGEEGGGEVNHCPSLDVKI